MRNEGVYWTDANVLLRFLTGELAELASKTVRLLERAQRGEISLKVHPVVAETVWVLESFYGHSKREIVGALESMAEKGVDFVDALLAETASSRGEGVASFDADFRKLDAEWHEPDS